MAAPDHGIVLWTLIVAAISTAIALAAAIIAYLTARYAKGAIGPLDEAVKGLKEVARLQGKSIQAAERMSKLEKLLREIETCGKVFDALLSISLIEERARAEAGDDLDLIPVLEDAKFLVARTRLLGAIHQLPLGLLPKAGIVADLPGVSGSDTYLEAARQEVVLTLDRLQSELPPPRDETLDSSYMRRLDARTGLSHMPVNHGRPASWAAASIIIVGFTVGGIAMVVGPIWWLFWTGAGIVVIGGIFALSEGIFDDWY